MSVKAIATPSAATIRPLLSRTGAAMLEMPKQHTLTSALFEIHPGKVKLHPYPSLDSRQAAQVVEI